MRKVEDASGSKYSGESAPSATSKGPPPPMTSKPVFTPTQSAGGSRSFAAPTARSRGGTTNAADDENDGWGSSAPQVSRTTLEKVESAYKPTKVNMAELTSQKQEPSRFNAPSSKPAANPDVIGGGYQPVGKVDIAAIRAKAQDKQDDRPTTVKGAYEPVGKVDIAAIRARAQGSTGGDDALSPARTGGSARGPISPARTGASAQDGDESGPKSLADRSSAFTQSERLTSMPKPKVANRIPSSTGSFGGTKAPAPLGLGFGGPAPAIAPSTQVGKNFGNQGGKTPAQLWAEKRAASGNGPPPSSTSAASPVAAQKSGGFQSGYAGKKWGAVEIPKPGQAMPSSNDDAVTEEQSTQEEEESTGNVGAIRDRFKNAAPIGVGRPSAARQPSTFEDDEEQEEDSAPAPPPMNLASKPNAGAGARGVPIPGMAQGRPVPTPQHDEEDEAADEPVGLPVPPPPQPPRTPEPEEDDEDYGDVRSSSPIRVVQPVSRTKAPHEIEPAEQHTSAPAMPIRSLGMVAPHESELDEEPQEEDHDIARGAAQATAASTFGAEAAHHPTLGSSTSGKRAIAQFDYEKAEENELELHEGEKVINIEMVDDDWWMGENSRGEKGLFPSNYVELVEDDEEGSAAPPPPPPAPAQATSHAAPPAPAASKGPTATAQYDYEALEDNELSFPDGATITNVVSLD